MNTNIIKVQFLCNNCHDSVHCYKVHLHKMLVTASIIQLCDCVFSLLTNTALLVRKLEIKLKYILKIISMLSVKLCGFPPVALVECLWN